MKTLFRIGIAWMPVYVIATSVLYGLKFLAPDLPFYLQTLVMTLILVSLMVTFIVPRVIKLANRLFDEVT